MDWNGTRAVLQEKEICFAKNGHLVHLAVDDDAEQSPSLSRHRSSGLCRSISTLMLLIRGVCARYNKHLNVMLVVPFVWCCWLRVLAEHEIGFVKATTAWCVWLVEFVDTLVPLPFSITFLAFFLFFLWPFSAGSKPAHHIRRLLLFFTCSLYVTLSVDAHAATRQRGRKLSLSLSPGYCDGLQSRCSSVARRPPPHISGSRRLFFFKTGQSGRKLLTRS